MATFEITLYARLIDSSLLEQQDLDYVRTAYAKGQRRVAILNKHMLPNALLPLLTVAALNFGALLGVSDIAGIGYEFDSPALGLLLGGFELMQIASEDNRHLARFGEPERRRLADA